MKIFGSVALAVLGLSLSSTSFAVPQCFDHGRELTMSAGLLESYIQSNVMYREVFTSGEVVKVLPTDTKGLQHEKFIINVEGQNVIIVHNLQLGQWVPVQPGTQIVICGEFLMAGHMPMIHWTHFDPSHRHGDGWMWYNNQVYGLRPGRPANWH